MNWTSHRIVNMEEMCGLREADSRLVVRDWMIRAGICRTSVIAEGSKEQETTMSSNVDFEASTS